MHGSVIKAKNNTEEWSASIQHSHLESKDIRICSEFKDQVLKSISQLKKSTFKWTDIFYLIFWFPKLIWKCREKTALNKQFKVFEWGESKIKKELDIEFIVHSIRKVNILIFLLLNRNQQILWKYQDTKIVSINSKYD